MAEQNKLWVLFRFKYKTHLNEFKFKTNNNSEYKAKNKTTEKNILNFHLISE